MATTTARLQSGTAHELVFTLLIEGVNLGFTTTADTSGMVTAYSSTDWTTFYSGLDIIGETKESIELFQPRITPNQLVFRITDPNAALQDLLFAPRSSVNETFLSSALSASDSSCSVLDTTDFASSGTIYIGNEAISYTSKSGAPDPTFNTLTRGKWGLWRRNGGSRLGYPHSGVLDSNGGRGLTPKVTDKATGFLNRQVAVLLHHKESDATASGYTWSTATQPWHTANARIVWAGRIKTWQDTPSGAIELSCTSIHERLLGNIFVDQFTADAKSASGDGAGFVADANAGVSLRVYNATSGTYNLNGVLNPTDTFEPGVKSAFELMAGINDQFQAWAAAASSHSSDAWSCELRETANGTRVSIRMTEGTTNANSSYKIGLHPITWATLGYSTNWSDLVLAGTREVHFRELTNDDSGLDTYEIIADSPPFTYLRPEFIRPGETVSLDTIQGSWEVQDDASGISTLPSEVNTSDNTNTPEGFVTIGKRTFVVSYSSSSGTPKLTIHQQFSANEVRPDINRSRGTLEDLAEPPKVRQVLLERGTAGEILLALILSTGTAGHNHSTYDRFAKGTGLAIPAELVDIASFQALREPYELSLESPKPFREIIEEILQVFNRYLIFDGRLRLTRPGFEVPQYSDIITLTEDNKADPSDRPVIQYGGEGILNQIILNYSSSYANEQFYKDEAGQNAQFTQITRVENSIVVNDETSQSDFQGKRTLEINARGILEPDAWAEYVARPTIAYFSRPFATITRGINATLVATKPGDLAKITDDHIIDPATNARGVSGLACWVKSVTFDWSIAKGFAELVFLPEHPISRYKIIGVSAKVDETHTTGGYTAGYDSSTKTLKLKQHEFSTSSESKDVTWLEVDDKVRIEGISPADIDAPTYWDDTIASKDESNDTITLTTGLAGYDTALEYVVHSVPITSPTSPQSSQRDHAFIADTSTELINSTYDSHLWANEVPQFDAYEGTVAYTTEYIRQPTTLTDADSPLSVHLFHHWVKNANNLLAYKTRNVLVSHVPWKSGDSMTATSTTYEEMFGPMFVPLYGISAAQTVGDRRQILGKFCIARSTTLTTVSVTVRVTSSKAPLTGSSVIAGVWAGAVSQSETTVASASLWPTTTSPGSSSQNIAAFNVIPTILNGQVGTWIQASLKGDSGNSATTIYLSELHLVEAALS